MSHKKSILFFADRLLPLFGGMEMHAQYFIDYFSTHTDCNLKAIITKNQYGEDCLAHDHLSSHFVLEEYLNTVSNEKYIVFFNSGRWIEELKMIRSLLPESIFIYRTGGNEIMKAPLSKKHIPNHRDRQLFWVDQINQNIDILVTNSNYTEQRLSEIGIKKNIFRRCVGGVDLNYIKSNRIPPNKSGKNIFLCASRFVPYKNHKYLIALFKQLKDNGNEFLLNLAGDGPLLDSIKKQITEVGLEGQVVFKGVLSNHQVLDELLQSDYYIQLSSEYEVTVDGGSYLHAEGMGRSILEAIACGTFVISTDTGAIAEIVTTENGILIDLYPIAHAASSLEKLLSSGKRTGAIVERYSWDNYFELYNKIFSAHEEISTGN